MRKTITSLALLLTSYWGMAQNPTLTWAKQLVGTTANVATSISADAAGNVITVGRFTGTVDLDPGTNTFTAASTGTANLNDIFISKVNSSGNFVWGITLGGVSTDAAFDVAVDGAGNVYVTGSYSGVVDFDPGTGVTNLTSNGGLDIFILKLDANGNYAFARSIGGGGNDEGYSIGVDGSGNIYTAGYFNQTVDFDASAGVNNVTSLGSSDAFTLKLNSLGAFQWVHQFGTTGPDQANCLSVSSTGFCYVGGSFQGNLNSGMLGSLAITGAGGNDGYVVPLTPTGTLNVSGLFVGSAGDEAVTGVALDEANNAIYVTGHYGGSIPGFSLTNVAGYDLFVQRVNLNASTKSINSIGWSYGIGGTLNQEGVSIDVDPISGRVFVSGYVQGTSNDFDPSAATTNISATGASTDGFLAGYTTSGSLLFAFGLGNGNFDITAAVRALNYNVYATGYWQGTTNVDPNGTNNLSSGASGAAFDSYILKYSSCAAPVTPSNITSAVNQTICSGKNTTLTVSATGTVSWYNTPTGGVALASGASYTTPVLNLGTTYYVEAFTCATSTRIAIPITVNNVPGVFVNSGAICSGNSFTIVPTGASTYTISGGSFVVNPTATTNYSIVGTSSLGCVSSNTAVSSVTVLATPAITVNASSTSVCLGSTVNLSGSGAATYTWNNGVSNGVSFSPTATANYSVIGTSASGCTTTANVNVAVISVASPTLASSTYSPLALTGFNQDVVANGSNFATSTTADVDGSGTRFIDATFTQFGTPLPGRHLPTGNVINSITSPNPTFILASYTANNSLRLPSTGNTGTLTLTTPTQMDMFYLLATSGSGSSNVDIQIFFTDNTSQTISNFLIDDWFNAPNAAMQGVGRVYNNVLDFNLPTSTNPRIYQYAINLLPANTTKTVSAVKFTNLNGLGATKITHILGMTARVSAQEFCQSVNPTVANLQATGSNLQWYNSSNVAVSNTVALVNGNVYSVTQATNGCQSLPVSIYVAVKSTPTVSVNSGAICSGKSFTMIPSGVSTFTIQGGNAVVTPSSTTSYTVVGTGTNGCLSVVSATSNVTVNATPTITVNSGSVCAGSSFTLNANGASSYTYQGGNAVVSPIANSSYSVIGSSTAGCLSSVVNASISVQAQPTVTAVSNTSLVCPGETVSLTANGAANYNWNTTATTAVIVVSPTVTTTYTVSGAGSNGCVNVASITQSVSACTGIAQLSNSDDRLNFNVYPNPSTGSITVELLTEQVDATAIQVVNMLGEVLVNETLVNQHIELNLSDLSNGVYFIKATNNGSSKTTRLIKN